MAVKNFLLEENQKAWDAYYNNAMKDFSEDNSEEFAKKKVSLAQYKCGVIAFEQYVKKSFNDVTAKDIETFTKHTDKKNKLAHLNAFLLASVSNGYISNTDTEFLIALLPKEYRKLGKMIVGNGGF